MRDWPQRSILHRRLLHKCRMRRVPASKWVTHVCCAQYFTPSAYGTPQETASANSYAAAVGNTTLQSSLAVSYANTVNSGTGSFTLIQCANFYANWKAWALSFGIEEDVRLRGRIFAGLHFAREVHS